ncbi:unnamed protein product, partial [Rotaria sp. Silwood2]
MLTIILHADGSPLVRSSRQSLWPLFASLIEIPPPARYYQRNILTLSLWSSRKKPDIDKFLHGTIAQLETLMQYGTMILLDGQQHRFIVRIQGFIADLPAKSLFLKTINFNGKFACTWCLSSGEYDSNCHMTMYPYEKNQNTLRTHDEFVRTGQSATSEGDRAGHEVVIDGVRGMSPLLSIIKYPIGVLYDYMHLVCINHISTLVKHWLVFMKAADVLLIDDKLARQKIPHNFNVRFDFSINEINKWKAKHGRLFTLYIGLPILINVLSAPHLLHFAAYVLAIKLLHVPENDREIDLAEQLLHFYCQSSSLIYGPSIELYSLHSHLHLPEQVRHHGGLSFTSAFAFESCIRYVKKKAHGSRHLASQIGYWTDMTAIIKIPELNVQQARGVDEILLENELLEEFRPILSTLLGSCTVKFYKRFKIPFITFHSTLYDKPFKCVSHVISYRHKYSDTILFADCIVFLEFNKNYFAFIRKYQEEAQANRLSSVMKLSKNDTCKISEPLDRLFSMQLKSNSFGIISMSRVRYKFDALNDLLDKHVLDTSAVDNIESVDEADASDELLLSSQPTPLTPGTKRAFKGSSSTISLLAKRSKNNNKTKNYINKEKNDDNDDDEDDYNYSCFQKNVTNKLDRIEVDGKYFRQMFEQLKSYHEQHEQTQLLILENQKKIKKALLKHKVILSGSNDFHYLISFQIYVDVEDSTLSVTNSESINSEDTFASEL